MEKGRQFYLFVNNYHAGPDFGRVLVENEQVDSLINNRNHAKLRN